MNLRNFCNIRILIIVFYFVHTAVLTNALYCYKCISTHPGCGETFSGIWYAGYTCPLWDDTCVKIIEHRPVSSRPDRPADTYEGCRSASQNKKLGHYVTADIKEQDIHRTYFTNITWCFCSFDERCNGSPPLHETILLCVFFPLLLAFLLS